MSDDVRDMADTHPRQSWWDPSFGKIRMYEVVYHPARERVTLTKKVVGPGNLEKHIEERITKPVNHERYERIVNGIKRRYGRVGQRAEREAYRRIKDSC